MRFPLGNLLKDETRDIARKLDLNVADKPDSQDICFVPNGDYASVIEKFRPNSFNKGNIKNMEGEVIGVHDGIINYTIGQRKGIKISDKNPLYVIKIIADKNEIIVGNKENLAKTKIDLKNLNIITKDKKDFEKELFVKVRSTGKLIKAKIEIKNTFANVNLFNGSYFDGHKRTISLNLAARAGYKVTSQLNSSYNEITYNGQKVHANLYGLKVKYSYSTNIHTLLYYQFNAITNESSTNIRFNFMHSPLSDLFIIFSERRVGVNGNQLDQGLAIKITKLFSL